MESLEIRAKTVEEAIQRAVEQLGVSREEVEVSVVREGRLGILGLGAEEAVVRVTPLVPAPESDIAGVAQSVLERLLVLLGVAGSIVPLDQPIAGVEKEASAPVTFNIQGDDLDILIGQRGQTLSCLQYIVRLIVGNRTGSRVAIVLDVAGYKQRRYDELQALARQMAEQVETKGMSITLSLMSPYERRIIHLTLADHPGVTTESIGQGGARRVVIRLKGQYEIILNLTTLIPWLNDFQ